jgi:hypothetical protein
MMGLTGYDGFSREIRIFYTRVLINSGKPVIPVIPIMPGLLRTFLRRHRAPRATLASSEDHRKWKPARRGNAQLSLAADGLRMPRTELP